MSAGTYAGLRSGLRALGVRRGDVTALYASARDDTGPFGFLHPAFLARRGVPMPAPTAYVYVDKAGPGDSFGPRLAFEDPQTRVWTSEVYEVRVAGHPAWALEVETETGDPSERRTCRVLRIRTRNDEVFRLCAAEGWTPQVFIAVKDGCAMGGNEGCENSLELEGSPLRYLPGLPGWWVTDHLGRLRGGWCVPGRLITSPDPAFPVAFRKVALLSTGWGFERRPFCGATVFEVESVPSASLVPEGRRMS